MSDYMYTCREMAKQMDMSMSQLRCARLEGVGPAFVRVKGQVRYPLSALTTWMLDGAAWDAENVQDRSRSRLSAGLWRLR